MHLFGWVNQGTDRPMPSPNIGDVVDIYPAAARITAGPASSVQEA
jgi:hypothetical protein